MKFFDIPMPENWPSIVRSAMLHVCSLAQFSITCSRSWCANSPVSRARLAVKLDQARNEAALLAEENDLLRARLSRLNPHARPHYTPIERMRILELRAARAWNAMQTAQRLLLEPDTVSSWLNRIEDSSGLVRIQEPLNKLPAFVRYAVQRLNPDFAIGQNVADSRREGRRCISILQGPSQRKRCATLANPLRFEKRKIF